VAGAGAVCLLGWLLRKSQRLAVTGDSMAPLFRNGDHLLVWKTARVRPGDVVAALDPRDPGRAVLKRAVDVQGRGVWLEGDNPEASTDSRHFGLVPLSLVKGRAIYRYAPPSRAGLIRAKRLAGANHVCTAPVFPASPQS